jgi:hypothetical protein
VALVLESAFPQEISRKMSMNMSTEYGVLRSNSYYVYDCNTFGQSEGEDKILALEST